MKKNYFLITLLIALSSTVIAQVPYRNLQPYQIAFQEMMAKKASVGAPVSNTNRDVYELYLDYSAANFDDLFYVWRYNSLYGNSDTALNYACTVLDEIAGYTDPGDILGTYIDWNILGLPNGFPNNTSLTLDTIFVYVTHENNSGQNDTFITQIINTTNGTPSTSSTVLWEGFDISNTTLSVGGNWVGTDAGVVLYHEAMYTTNGSQKVGINVVYRDPSKQDTASVAGGCIDNGSGGTDLQSVYDNSFMRYPPFIPNITKCINVGYGNPVGADGWFEAQNWIVWAKVHANVPIGIVDNFDNLAVQNVFPNPASNQAGVVFGLNEGAEVTVDLLDASGRYISTLMSGYFGAGSHIERFDVSNVASGLYLVSTKAGNGEPILSKFLVAR